MRLLVLSGTGDGRRLAADLRRAGHTVIESVAGRTAAARDRAGARVGGFGGRVGLVAWLQEHHIEAVVDATHPFAVRISAHAAQACAQAGVPLARAVRPSWAERPDAAGWVWVPDHPAAVAAVAGHGRVLLTVGRQELDAYRTVSDVIARVSEPPPGWLAPPGWEVLVARGPFQMAEETTLLAGRDIRVLVSKDSGGAATAAKLDAAAALGVRVVMVRRPLGPPGVTELASPAQVLAWAGSTVPGQRHSSS